MQSRCKAGLQTGGRSLGASVPWAPACGQLGENSGRPLYLSGCCKVTRELFSHLKTLVEKFKGPSGQNFNLALKFGVFPSSPHPQLGSIADEKPEIGERVVTGLFPSLPSSPPPLSYG